jgi:hypothetical protein
MTFRGYLTKESSASKRCLADLARHTLCPHSRDDGRGAIKSRTLDRATFCSTH